MAFFDLGTLVAVEDTTKTIHRQATCDTCKLYLSCSKSKNPVIGSGELPILIIGDTTSKNIEEHGKQGTRYNLISKYFNLNGIPIEKCWYVDAIRCYSKEDNISNAAMAGCHEMLMVDILKLKPKVIVTTSTTAFDVLLWDRVKGRAKSASYADYCGETIPDQVLNTWILPIFDTMNLLEEIKKNEGKPCNELQYYQPYYNNHIKTIAEYINIPVPIYNCLDHIQTTIQFEKALEWLEVIKRWPKKTVDLETTGLSPYKEGHHIACIAFSNGEQAFAFPWWQDNVEFMKQMKIIVESDSMLIAHNSAFERVWLSYFTNTPVKNLSHDSMIMQHCHHNKKPTNLKYCTYVNFGILGYDQEMDEFMKPSKEDAEKYGKNAINNIDNAPLLKLLRYCAEDTLYEYWLAKKLLSKLDRNLQFPGYKLFVESEPALTRMHTTGFRVDREKLKYWQPIVESRMDEAYLEVMNDPLILHRWRNGKFNPASDANIRTLLYTILKLLPLSFTNKGLPATDEDALEEYIEDCTLIPALIRYKKWYKVLNTFLKQMEREMVFHDGYWWVHSYFSLNNIDSYRSGSRNINMQNIPKHDKEMLEIIRSCLLPLPGAKIMSFDYKSLEVCGNAALTRDKGLLKYTSDLTTDMHKTFASVLFIIPTDKLNKLTRNVAKTNVFREFYGGFYVQMAKAVWKMLHSTKQLEYFGMNMMDHLNSKEIYTYDDWEKHCKVAEDFLWVQMFPGYQLWRKKTYKEFVENGYVYYPTGFKYEGPASRNAMLNGPGQGSSFHLNLWAIKEIDKILIEKGLRSRMMAEIHDDQTWSIFPEEEEYICHLVWLYGTQKVREYFPWMCVPLIIEMSSAPEINLPWSTVKEIKKLDS